MKIQQSIPMAYSPVSGRALHTRCTAAEYRCSCPSDVWSTNPWTGRPRDPRDVEIDSYGLLIIPPGEAVVAAERTVVETSDHGPLRYTEPAFLGVIPAGAQLIAVDGKVIVVGAGMAPRYVTPTGLIPIFAPGDQP